MTRQGAHDEGVSNVLGAILMFGLLVLSLTVVQVRFNPIWTEDREARATQRVADDLAQLKSDLDRQAGNDTATPVTTNIPLSSKGGFRLFQSAANQVGTAAFTPSPDGTGLAASTTKPTQVLRRGGLDLFASGSQWDPQLEGTTEVTNVASIEHLRQRIDLYDDVAADSYLDPSHGNAYDDGDSIVIEIYDATNTLVAWVTTTFWDTGSGIWFTMTIYQPDDADADALPQEISSVFEGASQELEEPYLFLDVLDGALFLEPLLANEQGPFRITLTEDGLIGDYQVVYTDADAGVIVGSAGVLETTGFTLTQPSGALEIDVHNQRYEDQTYTLEHGAVIVEQASGAAMITPPALGVAMSATTGSLTWNVGGIDGDGLTIAGDRVAVVSTPTGSVEDIWVATPQITLAIPTSNGDAWAAYLDDLLQDAGWTAGTYTLTTSSTSVQLLLEGPIPNDASCTSASQTNCDYDVSLRLRISNIDLTLAPAG